MRTPLSQIKGIGASTAKTLMTAGIKTAEDLASASIAQIAAVPGFGETRAQRVKEAAAAAIGSKESAPVEPVAVEGKPVEQEKQKKKKDKKKDKSKKKGKDKKKKKGKKKK